MNILVNLYSVIEYRIIARRGQRISFFFWRGGERGGSGSLARLIRSKCLRLNIAAFTSVFRFISARKLLSGVAFVFPTPPFPPPLPHPSLHSRKSLLYISHVDHLFGERRVN